MQRDKLLHYIALNKTTGIGPALAKKLIAYTGSVDAIFKEKKKNLVKIPGIGEKTAALITGADVFIQAEEELTFIEKNKIEVYAYNESNFPERLKHCSDAPLLLFFKGNCDLNAEKIISIVGTRKATQYGKSITENIIKELYDRNHNPIIVSGLAYGIDIAAHKAALKSNLRTIGVLGHGLDTIYPSVHRETAKQMLASGGLITDFASKATMVPENFIRRNRIIAGLADITIVVESSAKGGALVTADIAHSYNRDIFAVPGRINDKSSVGCNQLIKSMKANVFESVDDIEFVMNWEKPGEQKKSIQKQLFVEISDEDRPVLEILQQEQQLPIDLIAQKTNKPISKVSVSLLNLEFSGLVKTLPGKIYRIN